MPFESPLYHIPYEIDRFLLWDFPGSPQVEWSGKAAGVEYFVKSYLAIGGAENLRVRVEPAENRFQNSSRRVRQSGLSSLPPAHRHTRSDRLATAQGRGNRFRLLQSRGRAVRRASSNR